MDTLIKKVRSFVEDNPDKDRLTVSLKEEDIFKVLEEAFGIIGYKLQKKRDLDRWNMYYFKDKPAHK